MSPIHDKLDKCSFSGSSDSVSVVSVLSSSPPPENNDTFTSETVNRKMIIYLGSSRTSLADPRLFQEAQNILDPQASWVSSIEMLCWALNSSSLKSRVLHVNNSVL